MVVSPATDVALGKLITAKAGLVAIDLALTKVLVGAMVIGAGGLVIVGAGMGIRALFRRR